MSRAKRRKVEPAAVEPKATRTALRREIRRLARSFADELLELLDHHGMWDRARWAGGAAVKGRGGGADSSQRKRVRRSADALQEVGGRILAELKRQRRPVAISTIAAALGHQPREIAHPIALLVSQGLVAKTGERRGTRYRLTQRRSAVRRRSRDRARQPKKKQRR